MDLWLTTVAALRPKKKGARGQKRSRGSSSEEDVDDPPSSSAPVVFTGKLKAGDHMIYGKEGTQFPALVLKCHKKMYKVKKMAPIFRSGEEPLWKYEAGERLVYPNEVLHSIPAPEHAGISSGRHDNQYSVEKMGEYWRAAPSL